MSRFVELVVSAVLLAGLYATTAYGLGLIYGVLRVVNLAHGGAIMAGAYVSWVLFDRLGIDPYLAIPVVAAFSFALRVVVYGVWLVLRNIAYLAFTGNDQTIRTGYSLHSLAIAGSHVSLTRFVVLGIS